MGARLWETPLPLNSEQTEGLVRCAREAASDASKALCRLGVPDGTVDVCAADCRRLSEVDPARLSGGGDVAASVVCRLEGTLCGSALLSLEPSDALAWVNAAAPDEEVLDAFVRLGGTLVVALLGTLARPFAGEVTLASARLDERPVAASLLATHAPSDASLVSIDLLLRPPDVSRPASLHLLVDGKWMDEVVRLGS